MAVQFAWAIILVIGMLILPETPRFLIKKDKHEAAAKALARLRRLDINDSAIVEELAEIQANHQFELSLGKATYLEILRGSIGKRLATGCAVQALQQLAGVNFICTMALTLLFHYPWTYANKVLRSLLRHHLLPKLRYQELVCDYPNYQHYQCRLNFPWSIHGGEMGSPASIDVWRGGNVCLATHCGYRWYRSLVGCGE